MMKRVMAAPPVPAVEPEGARIPAIRRAPRALTRQEIHDYILTHLPRWCPCCLVEMQKGPRCIGS